MQQLLAGSPLVKVELDLTDKHGIHLYIKREELIHPEVQGNKWRKLKYNFKQAQSQGFNTLITFGGPYSNHIYATAAAANYLGLKSVGIISGNYQPETLTPTLQYARSKGMQLRFVSREEFKKLNMGVGLEMLEKEFGPFYHIPQGGTNGFALKGVAELVDEIKVDYDVICTACGTGGTLAGLVAALKGEKQVLGFSALKGEDGLTAEVNRLVFDYSGKTYANFKVLFGYHFGGYAKVTPQLISFIKEFRNKTDVQLEAVYTGKMFYGLLDMIEKGYFDKGTRIVALHTGGLQGLSGFADEFPEWRTPASF